MIEIYCEKLYKYSRIEEPVSVTIPFKKGAYTKTEDMAGFAERQSGVNPAKGDSTLR